jgi:hypothetical protein
MVLSSLMVLLFEHSMWMRWGRILKWRHEISENVVGLELGGMQKTWIPACAGMTVLWLLTTNMVPARVLSTSFQRRPEPSFAGKPQAHP